MANVVKYQNQTHPTTGDRMSTNGHYTGAQVGTPTQDELGKTTTNVDAHYVEANIVRYGTITQDTVEGSTPEVDAD